ncbi:MAG: hypothetical protein ACQEQ0_14280, partial [Bacteroidota bacterium]
AEIDEAGKDRMARHIAFYQQHEDEKKIQWQWRLYREGVNIHALTWWLIALGEVEGTAYVRVDLDSKDQAYKFFYARKNIPDFSGSILCLDGTGNQAETESLFERSFNVVNARIDLSANEKNWIRTGLGKVKAEKLSETPEKLKEILKDAVRFIRPEDRRVLLTTHMVIEDQTREMLEEMLPDKEVGSIHYYGNRGINRYQDFDAVIAFGAPGTNQRERLDEAMVLFPDPADHPAWFEHKAEAELLQSIHRIRPVNGGKNIILVSRRWPEKLGDVSAEIDRRKGSDRITHSTEEAYRRLERFYKVHNFCCLEIAYVLSMGPMSAKKVVSMVGSPSYRHPIKTIIYGDDKAQTRRFTGRNRGKRINSRDFPAAGCSKILWKRKNTWSDLIRRLQSEQTGQLYENKVHGRWTLAYGSLDGVREFCRMTGLTFNPDNWRKRHE